MKSNKISIKEFESNFKKLKKETNIIAYTKSDKQLLDYIQQSFTFVIGNRNAPEGWHYKGQYDFILQHGKFYNSQELTDEEREIVSVAIKNLGFKPRMKECFYNAQMLALNDYTNKIQYCEGFGMSLIPCNHGWCVINDKVIDLTWKDESGNNYFGEFDKSYLGFTLTNDVIRKKQLKTSMAVSFLDDWHNGWEIFLKPFIQ